MIPYNAQPFSITGSFPSRVVSLHDGDTITCVIDFRGVYHRFSFRMDGIDTPEMTSKDPELKKKALLSRQRLFELITNKYDVDTRDWKKKNFDVFFEKNYTEVTLDCKGLDKYGRVLATIGDPSFSSILVQEGLAYPYSGKTKLTEQEQLNLKSLQ